MEHVVLLVEPEAELRDAVRDRFAAHGYRVLPAASEVEALERLHTATRLEAAVLDGGLAAALLPRLREWHPDCQVIVTVAESAEIPLDGHAGPQAGGVVRKPFAPGVLLTRVAMMLEKARSD